MPKERQTTWAGGEFSPKLRGRTDLQRYAAGASKLLNFFVEPTGALSNRPGTQHVVELTSKYAGSPAENPHVWLIPFTFSDDDTVMIVHIHEKMFFIRRPSELGQENSGNHNFIEWLIGQSGGNLTTVDTPYNGDTANTLQDIRTAQIGNFMTHVHPLHAVRELRRLLPDGTLWSFDEVSFDIEAFPPYGGVPRLKIVSKLFPRQDSDLNANNLVAQDRQGNLSNGGLIQGPIVVFPPDGYNEGDFALIGTDDAAHPARPWEWKITRILEDEDGRVFETAPFLIQEQVFNEFQLWRPGKRYFGFSPEFSAVPSIVRVSGIDDFFYTARRTHDSDSSSKPVVGGNASWTEGDVDDLSTPGIGRQFANIPEDVVVFADREVTVHWREYTQLPSGPQPLPTDLRIIGTRIYRGQDEHFGFIGEVPGDATSFLDTGLDPNLSDPPPAARNPFEVFDSDGNLIRTERPSVVTYFQNRLYLARTAERPDTAWASSVDQYRNFDEIIPADDSDSLQFTIASKQLEAINALAARRELLVFSANSEWAVTGSQGELITPNSIAARLNTKHGCAPLDVVEMQEVIAFMAFKGTSPWALIFSTEGGGYRSVNISKMSRHLFVGHTIVSWAYAEDPYSILWAVRDDGLLLSLTISLEDQMIAWAQHTITGGNVESVGTIPEGTEDGVYLVVNRNGTRSIERLASREITDARQGVFLDRSVTKGLSTTAERVEITVTDDLEFKFEADLTVRFYDTNGVLIVVDSNLGKVLQVEGAGTENPGRIEVAESLGGGLMRAIVISNMPEATALDVLVGYTRCFDSLTGLTHLDGQSVVGLVDGSVVRDLEVISGTCDLGGTAAVATVGLPYVSDFESLDMVADKSRRKTATKVYIELENARGGKVGATFDNLQEIRTRQVADAFGAIPLRVTEQQVTIPGRWKQRAQVAFRNEDPLPVTILGLTRDYVFGGD